METPQRPSGIEGLGDLSFGTHFCLFYETEQDLIETLVLYFKTGLANNELCLWITSDSIEKARNALRQVIPSADQHLEAGQIEILACQQWYCVDNIFDATRTIQALDAKLSQALEKGYARMRVLGDEAWLSQEHWKPFSDYEGNLDTQFGNKPLSIVCAYPAHAHNAADILDIARTHRFIAAKRNGKWEILESSDLKHVKAELEAKVQERTAHLSRANQALQAEIIERRQAQEALTENQVRLQVALQSAQIGTGEWDLQADQVSLSEGLSQIYGFAPGTLITSFAEFAERVHPEDRERFRNKLAEALASDTDFGLDYRVVWPDGSVRWVTGRAHIHRDELRKPTRMVGASMDITERKQAEEALRVSQARLQAAIDAADIVLWERDLSSGHITWLGHHEKLLGFAPGELDENTLASFEKRVHPEDIEGLRKVRQRALEEQSEYSHEYRVVWRDGSIHWIRAQGRFIYNEAGQPVRLYGAVLDITERKRAEEALRKSEQVLREAESLGHTGSWEQNLVTGEIFNTEENLRLFFGDDRSKGANFEDYAQVVHPDDHEYVLRRRAELLDEEGPSDIEYRAVWPDGSIHVIFGRATVVRNEAGQPIRVYGTNVDITERKRAEEALRKSEENFRTLADKSQQGITIYQDSRVAYANPAQAATTGYSIDELKSMSAEELVSMTHPDDRATAMERIRKRTTGEALSPSFEFRIVRKDGATRWIQSFNNDIQYNGRPAVLSSNIDITVRKQAEEGIRQYALRMETLAEISRTFVQAGLDYRSILNTVARRTSELIGDSCVITLFSDDAKRSFPVAFHHPDPKALSMMHDALMHTWQGGTDTQRYQALLAGNSIHIPSVNPEEFRASLESEFWAYLEAVGISSVLIVPLQVQGHVIGTLGLTRDRGGSSYTHDDQVLLQNIADRAAMSIQNARLFEQVQGAREQLEALSKRLLEVQEAERRALTTELHDRVGQNLTGLSINLQNMKALLSQEEAQELASKFDDAQALVEDTTRQIRAIMAELYLPELEDYGLAAALETYAERAASRGNLELITDLPDLDPALPMDVRVALFRAAQEAISNVLKHADATQLEISLHGNNGRVHLRVEDDGKGFDPNTASQKEAQTWGLKIMHERIESIGGTVQIDSEPGEGTRVTFEIERSS